VKPPDKAPHPTSGTPLPAGGERGKGVRGRGFRGVAPGYSCSAPAGLSARAVIGDPRLHSVLSLPHGFETALSVSSVVGCWYQFRADSDSLMALRKGGPNDFFHVPQTYVLPEIAEEIYEGTWAEKM